MSDTREYLEGIFSGRIPIKRKNPQTGIKEDVYYDYDDDKDELVEIKNTPLTITHPSENHFSEPLISYVGDEVVKKATFYPLGYGLGSLISAKKEMDEVEKNIVHTQGPGKANGTDNYYHRLGMCQTGQEASSSSPFAYSSGIGLGLLKEGADIAKKSLLGNIPWKESINDSLKDMRNNLEGLNYGLQNPDKDCRVWLRDLDWKTNRWNR